MSLSRDTFYRYKAAVEQGGIEAFDYFERLKNNLERQIHRLNLTWRKLLKTGNCQIMFKPLQKLT